LRAPGDILAVKRIVAIGGDVVHTGGGQVFVNGISPKEASRRSTENPDSSKLRAIGLRTAGHDLTLPPGWYYVTGDNARDSVDSREWGPIGVGDIVGPVVYIFHR
jgi:signal peptidase I